MNCETKTPQHAFLEERLNTRNRTIAQFAALSLAGLLFAGQNAAAQTTGGFTPGNVVVYAVDGHANPISIDPVTYLLLPNAQYLIPDLIDTPHDTPGPVTFKDPSGVTHTYPANTNTVGTQLGNWSHQVFLLELNPAGSLTGKSYVFPSVANGANHRLTVSGTAGSVGGLSVSLNGKYLLETGIDAAIGGRGPIKNNFAIGRSNSIHYPRVVGIVDWTNPDSATAIDTTTALTNAYDQENITNVAWTGNDSDPLYIAGNGEPPTFYDGKTASTLNTYTPGFVTTGGVTAATRGASVGTQNYAGGSTSVENVYRVVLNNGMLYGSAADAGTYDANNQPQGQVLFGLAKLTPGATTALPGFSTTSTAGFKQYDFFFDTQVISGVPTPVVYVADNGVATGGVQKWIYDSDNNVWGTRLLPTDTFTVPNKIFGNYILTGLAGTYNAQGQVVIYGIANGSTTKGAPTSLVAFTDDGTANPPVTQIAVVPSDNTQTWRGVAVVPPTISGRVTLDGMDTSKISPSVPLGNLTVKYRLVGTMATYFSQTVPLSVDATDVTNTHLKYTLPGVAPAYYDIALKTDKNLQVVLHNVKVGGPFTLPDVTLPGGDANNDNRVDVLDFGVLVNSYGSAASDPTSGYDATADFNNDGQDDVLDFGILVNNYGATGDM